MISNREIIATFLLIIAANIYTSSKYIQTQRNAFVNSVIELFDHEDSAHWEKLFNETSVSTINYKPLTILEYKIKFISLIYNKAILVPFGFMFDMIIFLYMLMEAPLCALSYIPIIIYIFFLEFVIFISLSHPFVYIPMFILGFLRFIN